MVGLAMICFPFSHHWQLSLFVLRLAVMWPILGRYGSFFLYSYTVVWALGFAAAIVFTYLQLNQDRRRWLAWFDGLLAGLGVGIVVGRLVYVTGNAAYFYDHPGQMIQLWQGGLNYHGAVGAGLLVFGLWQWGRGVALRPQLDTLVVPLIILTGFGWLACYLEGCAYGRETVLGLWAGNLPDSYGVFQVRYQTQLLGLLWSGIVLALVVGIRGRVSPLTRFWLTLLLLSAGRIILSILRGDAMPTWNDLRLDTLADGVLALVVLSGLLFSRWFRQ
jgi:phosphatidylglycerol:prolipoprotein diacylglycerol transferase